MIGTDLSYYKENNSYITLFSLPEIPYNDVTDMKYMFRNCKNLQEITSYNYSNNTYTYSYTYSYSNICIQNNYEISYNYSYEYSMSYICNENINIFNGGNVKDMSNMFENCKNLITVNLGYFNISNCTNMSKMFSYCENLQSVIFGNYYPNPLLVTEQMFYNCKNLSYVFVPNTMYTYFGNIIGESGFKFKSYKYNDINELTYNINKIEYLEEIDRINLNDTTIHKLYITCTKINSLIIEDEKLINNSYKILMFYNTLYPNFDYNYIQLSSVNIIDAVTELYNITCEQNYTNIKFTNNIHKLSIALVDNNNNIIYYSAFKLNRLNLITEMDNENNICTTIYINELKFGANKYIVVHNNKNDEIFNNKYDITTLPPIITTDTPIITTTTVEPTTQKPKFYIYYFIHYKFTFIDNIENFDNYDYGYKNNTTYRIKLENSEYNTVETSVSFNMNIDFDLKTPIDIWLSVVEIPDDKPDEFDKHYTIVIYEEEGGSIEYDDTIGKYIYKDKNIFNEHRYPLIAKLDEIYDNTTQIFVHVENNMYFLDGKITTGDKITIEQIN